MTSSSSDRRKIGVAVLGATGVVGQKFIQLLDGHPVFVLVAVTTGRRESQGRLYGDVTVWRLGGSIPACAAGLRMIATDPATCAEAGAVVAFSALPTDVARSAEPLFARAGFAVCSNSSPYRMAADVPLLIPEVNPASVRPMVAVQRRRWQQQRPLLGQS